MHEEISEVTFGPRRPGPLSGSAKVHRSEGSLHLELRHCSILCLTDEHARGEKAINYCSATVLRMPKPGG